MISGSNIFKIKCDKYLYLLKVVFLYRCVSCPKTFGQPRLVKNMPNRVETWHNFRVDEYLGVFFSFFEKSLFSGPWRDPFFSFFLFSIYQS